MPILHIEDDNNLEDTQHRTFKTQEEMQTSTIFHKEKPLDTIIEYVKGMKCEVTYFLQVRDLREDYSLPDLNLPPTTQKYNRINKLIIYLQSPIEQDNINNIQGEAIINAGFLPNMHDVFLLTLTGGREALFSITDIQTKTYNLHPAYYITFKLFCFVDTHAPFYNDVVNKTVKEYTYDKEYLLDYSAPVILQTDYVDKINLKDSIRELIDYYFNNFVNKEKKVIALPTKSNIYVDTLLIEFIFKIVNYSDHVAIPTLTNLDLNLREDIPYSIWDVIVTRDKKLLKKCIRDIGFKYTPFNYSNIITRKMNALGIRFTCGVVDSSYKANMDIVDMGIEKGIDYVYPFSIEDRKYVVGNSVYNLDGNYSMLERLLVDYLDGKMLDTNDLKFLLSKYMDWDTIDQYYGIPILIVLVKDAVSRTFKSL